MKKALLLLFAVSATAVYGQSPTIPAASSPRGQIYYYYANAKMLEAQGQYNQGIDELKKALVLEPGNSFIFSSIANIYLRNRRPTDAAEYAEKAVKADPDNADPHELLSRIYFEIYGDAVRTRRSAQERAAALTRTVHEFEELVRIDPSNQQAALNLGRLYQEQGAPEKAEEIYRKLLGKQPDSESAVKALAQLQLDSGSYKTAIATLEAFLASRPDSEDCWQMLGDAYSSINQFDKAAAAYKHSADLVPEDADYLRAYAQALFADTQYEEAGKVYQKLYLEDRTDLSSLVLLAEVYRHQMDFDKARQALGIAAQVQPNNVQIELSMAMLDRDDGRLEDALKRVTDLLRTTARANGNYSEAERQNRRRLVTQAALLQSTLGRYDDAIKLFGDLRTLTPNDKGRVDSFIVDAYRDSRNLDKALAHADSALKESPDNRSLTIVRADIIAEKGRVDEAVQVLNRLPPVPDGDDLDVISATFGIYERAKKFADAQRVLDGAVKRFPDELQIYFLQGALYEKQDRYAEAETAFRKALELEKNNPAALNYLGYMLADRGTRLDEALQLIKKAVAVDPGNGAYLDSLGWVYFRMDRFDLAEQFLKKAVRFVDRDADIHDHLGELYFKTGAYENARTEWTRALQLSTDAEDIQKFQKKLDALKTKVAEK